FLLVQGFSKNSCKNLALGYKSRFSAVFFDYFTIPRVYALFSKPYVNFLRQLDFTDKNQILPWQKDTFLCNIHRFPINI
ncbi:hypothetical protein ABE419_12620, partial [Brevibacillus agri]|uniref:hypothetical protein n=1 Tax=Brevibacillus agri TaxID=51101 RepID=UPI003D22819C